MAELAENIISFIKDYTEWHVGEVIPDFVESEYVWLMQSGQDMSERLDDPTEIDKVYFDVEIVSSDIAETRETVDTIKEAFRGLDKFPAGFEDEVEYFEITNHDDQYIPKASIGKDEPLFVGALSLTVNLA